LTNSSLLIRPAHAGDYATFTRLFPELGVDDPVPSLERWSAELAPTTLIAERAARPVGYAFFQLLDTVGYVRNVVSAPEARRTGVGKALMLALAEHFRSRGAETWCLSVKPDNLPAIRLYEALGMRFKYASAALRIRWRELDALPADPADAIPAAIAAADDAALESALHLASGMLADMRKRGRVMVGLFDRISRAPLGAAAFDPAFPGALPFRVLRAEYAPALLRALRGHALPELDWVQLVLEDDPALVSLLKAAGASVYLEFVQYCGALTR